MSDSNAVLFAFPFAYCVLPNYYCFLRRFGGLV